jgi:hypothetical protein
MAQQKQITLRNIKGSALTYAEMDQNLSSFFYSASLSGADLLLHYTGSTVLGPDYSPSSISVPLNPLLATITQLQVAGNNVGEIQYRIDNSTLGADTSFKWDTNYLRLGVGVSSPTATVDIKGTNEATIIRLNSDTATGKQAFIDFRSGPTLIASFGKTRGGSSDIYTDLSTGRSLFTTVGGASVTQTNSTGLGIFTPTSGPNKALTVIGEIGVGTDTGQNQGQIGNIITPQYPTGKVLANSLPLNSTNLGLLIESPKKLSGTSTTGGNVVIGVNSLSTNRNYAFSVLTNTNTDIYSTPLLTVKADGKVGINNANPTQALDIVGSTTMTDTLTIGNVTDSQGANAQILTRNSTTGLVQYTTNIMPLGGIIMWGGSPTSLPTGWTLCDGRAAVNGVTIPDLRERFIVGAGGDNPQVIDYNYDEFRMSGNFVFTTSGIPGTLPQTFNNALFTKVSDSAAVDGSQKYQFPYLTTVGGMPNVSKQHAVYYLNGGTATTSFFIVYNTSVNRYVMYRGILPTTSGTSLSNESNYPYFQLPIGAHAVLKQVANNITYRPNYILLSWQQNTTGYNVNDTGGFNHVELEISEMPSHTHTPGEEPTTARFYQTKANDYELTGVQGGGGFSDPSGHFDRVSTTGFTGNDFPHENRPPYYALAFIIYTGI